jgi:hypothetical protein
MKKKDWGNANWTLFHTLAHKLKPEYNNETPILFSHIVSVCNNLPCPDCREHASSILALTNRKAVTSSQENLKQFLFAFHNVVNKKVKNNEFLKHELDALYSRANTKNVVSHFIQIMSSNMNNDKLMMDSFRRQNYMNKFITYINENSYKYNP